MSNQRRQSGKKNIKGECKIKKQCKIRAGKYKKDSAKSQKLEY